MKFYVAKMYIHNDNYSCFSNKDIEGYRTFINEKEFNDFYTEVDNALTDKTIYKESSENVILVKFHTSFNKCKDYIKFFPEKTSPAVNAMINQQRALRTLNRLSSGFVQCSDYNLIMPGEIKGSLDIIWNHPIVKAYRGETIDSIKNAGGYIGAQERMHKHDYILESVAKVCNEEELANLARWVNSGTARHYMDDIDEESSLDDMTNYFLRIAKGE